MGSKMDSGMPPIIQNDEFVERMENRWIEMGNISSPALKSVWWQIAEAFNLNISSHGIQEMGRRWIVLQPPTGTGKTQGAVVYASMLSELPEAEHPGVLIVTRLITDADLIAEEINTLSGREVAVAFHSGSDTRISELGAWPVLVITHRAYELALDYLGQAGTIRQTWPFFHDWGSRASEFCDRRRKLVIIDEALDIVEQSEAGLDGLRQTLAALPQSIREEFPREIEAIKKVIGILEEMTRTNIDVQGEALLRKEPAGQEAPPDFTPLRKALRERARYDHQLGKNDLRENERLKKLHDERLKSLDCILKSWLYYAKVLSKHTLNTARLLVPEDVKGAVVLDATASSSVLYELFKPAQVWAPPGNSRNYGNVMLHVSKGHSVGKSRMEQEAKKRCPALIADLNERLHGRKVFVVCHKTVEPALRTFQPTFEMSTGHWGKVDGSNQWKDCDSCVVFGLPYRPDTWTANAFMAYQGPQETDWLRSKGNRPWGNHPDIRQALKLGQMVTEIVQAINRVRCRKVIDKQGNCPTTDVYVLLPSGSTADDIIEGIKHEMPGINVAEDWDFTKEKPEGKRLRRAPGKEAIMAYLERASPGRYSKSCICEELGIGEATMKRFLKDMPEATLAEMGVEVECKRERKSSRVYFMKDS